MHLAERTELGFRPLVCQTHASGHAAAFQPVGTTPAGWGATEESTNGLHTTFHWNQKMKAAVFFERDGVLNLCASHDGVQAVPLRFEDFRINPVAAPLLASLKASGFVLIATTNQPGVSRGDLTRNELDLMHGFLKRKLPLDDVMLCPYDDESHPSCKPRPGMFMEASFKWRLDLDHSFIISDKWSDAKAAQIAGCTSIMIDSPWIGDDHHDFVVSDLAAAVAKIEHLQENRFSYKLAGA